MECKKGIIQYQAVAFVVSKPWKKVPFADGESGIPRPVSAELLRLLYGALPIVLAANLVNALLVVVLFAHRLPAAVLGIWFGLLAASTGLRVLLWARYRRTHADARAGPMPSDRIFADLGVAGSAVSGALWGIAGAAFYDPADVRTQVLLGFVLGGMGAGAVATLAPWVRAFYVYLILSVLPFALRLATSGLADQQAMAVLTGVYTVSLLLLGHRVHGWLVETLTLRLANATLVQELEARVEQRTRELQEANAQLSRDIAERQRAHATLSDYGDRQAAVAVFGQRALSGSPLETLFEEAVRLVVRRLRVAGATVLQWDTTTDGFAARAHAGWSPAPTARDLVPTEGSSPAARVLCDGSPVVSDDIVEERRFTAPESLRAAGLRSSAYVRIECAGQPFGILEAHDDQVGRFAAAELSFLQTVASMLAASIDRKEAEADIQRLALVDSLTGLPNRALFRERLLRESSKGSPHGRLLAVMILDLDHFKDVNDTLGHPVGDRLLTAVAGRLRSCIREGEPPARLGGDEFAIVVTGQRERADVAAIAGKLINALSDPFIVDGHEIRLGASIGITLCPTDGTDPDTLLRNADLALYRAKSEGRNTYEFYASDMTAEVEVRKALERDLRLALSGNGLDVLYQPQFDLRSDRITTVEALVRWPHSTRGMLLPDSFVPMAETSGLVVPLGVWVLEKALRQNAAWRSRDLPPVVVAVNLSPTQCRRADLVGTVERIARRCGCDIRSLELEVQEGVFLPHENRDCVDELAELQRRGVTISLDDFGTGYSSMGRLHGLPVNKIKIDKGFVEGIGQSRDSETIVRAMIALASSLDLEVVAEGVETEDQLDFLRMAGCHGAQGFLLAQPTTADMVAAALRRPASSRQRGVQAIG